MNQQMTPTERVYAAEIKKVIVQNTVGSIVKPSKTVSLAFALELAQELERVQREKQVADEVIDQMRPQMEQLRAQVEKLKKVVGFYAAIPEALRGWSNDNCERCEQNRYIANWIEAGRQALDTAMNSTNKPATEKVGKQE